MTFDRWFEKVLEKSTDLKTNWPKWYDIEVENLQLILDNSSTEFHDISEAKKAVDDPYDNWLYDRVTQTLIVDIEYAHHDQIMAGLYSMYSGNPHGYIDNEAAEKYLTSHYGFFISGARQGYGEWHAIKSASYRLDAQEKMVFKGIPFHSLNIAGIEIA